MELLKFLPLYVMLTLCAVAVVSAVVVLVKPSGLIKYFSRFK
jgi:hypothetical protein